jgi:hypothetical protein
MGSNHPAQAYEARLPPGSQRESIDDSERDLNEELNLTRESRSSARANRMESLSAFDRSVDRDLHPDLQAGNPGFYFWTIDAMLHNGRDESHSRDLHPPLPRYRRGAPLSGPEWQNERGRRRFCDEILRGRSCSTR